MLRNLLLLSIAGLNLCCAAGAANVDSLSKRKPVRSYDVTARPEVVFAAIQDAALATELRVREADPVRLRLAMDDKETVFATDVLIIADIEPRGSGSHVKFRSVEDYLHHGPEWRVERLWSAARLSLRER